MTPPSTVWRIVTFPFLLPVTANACLQLFGSSNNVTNLAEAAGTNGEFDRIP